MPVLNAPLDCYKHTLLLWEQTEAAIEGKNKILEMQGVALVNPMYKNEDERTAARRKAYWKRARYFNATGRTHESFNGMVWSKPPEVEMPTQLSYLEKDASGSRLKLRVVAQKVVNALTGIGRYGALVDMPNAEAATREENESGLIAPHIIPYTAKRIVYWRVDGQLQEVRLLETYQKQVDEFTFEDEEQVRRLVLIEGIYHNQVYREDALYTDVTPKMSGAVMSFIPFQFFGADDNSADIGSIPLFDLGSQNLGHYTLDADNRDNLHYHGQGMTVVYTDMDTEEFNEANPNGLDVGAKGMNQLNQSDKVEVLQIQSTGAIAAEMLRDEQRMAMLGAQLVQNTNSTQTLGAKKIETNAETSVLKRIVENASEGLEQCVQWCADFLGVKSEVKYKLNTQFITDDLDPQMLAQHFMAVQAGYLPMSTYFESARKAGLTRKDDEALKQEIGEQSMGVQGTSEEMARLMAENEALKEQLNERS